MGTIEEELGNLPAAVNWWIKSIIIQVSVRKVVNDEPFLKLSYIAGVLGHREAWMNLWKHVKKIQGDYPSELIGDATIKLNELICRTGTESMKKAINLLNGEYLS